MILKGSQRGGPRQLGAHLLNLSDNDHVTVQEVRGFVAEDVGNAMIEAAAIARGTRCRQPLFSLSVNPPKDADVSLADMMGAIDKAEETLGLTGQPRAVVVHEKEGRRHAHVVWSRIDAQEMKAINLPFFKSKLSALSKELYLEHEWTLPEGHRTDGWKNPLNFTLAEWQQSKRHDLDPREVKQIFRDAWERSDSLTTFRNALEESGYFLAKGDRRGIVAADYRGEVYSVSRWAGLKTKEMKSRLGDGAGLPSLSTVQDDISKRTDGKFREYLKQDQKNKAAELQPHLTAFKEIVARQRLERTKLTKGQASRQRQEAAERAGRFRRGLGIVLDVLTGNLFKLRKRNEAEAYAAFVRDRRQRETLFADQAKEREPRQKQIHAIRARHRQERMAMAARIASLLKSADTPERGHEPNLTRRHHDYSM